MPTRTLPGKQLPNGVGSKFFLNGVHCSHSKVPDTPDTIFTKPMMNQTNVRGHPSTSLNRDTANPVFDKDVTVMAIVEAISSDNAN